MGYLNENGLARYDGLIKNWVTFKSGTVDGVDPLLNWQKTETAASVAFYPLPAAPLDPVVNFAFTETGPSEGTKGSDNPSTITGVSSITVTRCETVGVDSTDYTISLGGTFYGGFVDLSAGTITVTWAKVVFTGTGIIWSRGTPQENTVQFYSTLSIFPNRNSTREAACSHFNKTTSSSDVVGFNLYANGEGGFFKYPDPEFSIEDFNSYLAAQYANGTPVTVIYLLQNPATIPLTPLQIYSLSQPDPYTPRINTVYSDQQSVQVGYPKSPQTMASELTNAIISLGGNV